MNRRRDAPALQAFAFGVLAFLALPNLLIALLSFNASSTLGLPPTGFSLRWYVNLFEIPSFAIGLRHSVTLAVISSLVSLALGTLVSLAIVRFRFFGRQIVNVLVTAPLFVPEVVMGIAMLLWTNLVVHVSNATSLVLLHCLIVLPYIVRLIVANLQTMDPNLESAAMLLGARPFEAFVHITMPILAKGLMGAAVFAVVMSFHNFTATLFLVGSEPTLPVAAYQYIRTESDPSVCALSTLMMLGGILAVYAIDRWLGLERIVR